MNEPSGNSGQLQQPSAAARLNEPFGDSEQLGTDAGDGGDARAKFEAWADSEGLILSRHGNGSYGYERAATATAWGAWQAALPARQAAQGGTVTGWRMIDGVTVFDVASHSGIVEPQQFVRHADYLASRQSVGVEPVAWQWRSRIKGGAWDAWENGRYAAEPAPFMDVEHRVCPATTPAPAAVPVDQFRDADHLAEWLGSLVSACGQEEWDAAQAAINGIRAFQNHPDAVERLRAAIEGECDGLAVSGQQACAILAHLILPEPDGFFATHPQPAAACVNINATRYLYLRAQPVEGGPWGTPRIAIPSSERAGQFANGEDADAAIDAAIAAQQAKPEVGNG